MWMITYTWCDEARDLLPDFVLTCELEPDLQNSMDWGIVRCNASKDQLLLFDCSSNSNAINAKMDECVSDKRSF